MSKNTRFYLMVVPVMVEDENDISLGNHTLRRLSLLAGSDQYYSPCDIDKYLIPVNDLDDELVGLVREDGLTDIDSLLSRFMGKIEIEEVNNNSVKGKSVCLNGQTVEHMICLGSGNLDDKSSTRLKTKVRDAVKAKGLMEFAFNLFLRKSKQDE